MGFFNIFKKNEIENISEEIIEVEDVSKDTPKYDRSKEGPFDSSEKELLSNYLDLNSLKVPLMKDLSYSLEFDESSSSLQAISFYYQGVILQVKPYSCKKSGGVWDSAIKIITQEAIKNNAQLRFEDNLLGSTTVTVSYPTLDAQAFRRVHYIGIDGIRWSLIGTILGNMEENKEAYVYLMEVFTSIIVYRDNSPMPHFEPLQLDIPTVIKK